MVDVVGCRLFLFEKREYISVAQFGLVAYLKTKFESNAKSVASRRGWDFRRDTRKVASPWTSVTSFALLSYFY